MKRSSSAKEAAIIEGRKHSYAGPEFACYEYSQMQAMFLAGVRWARRQAKKRRAGK